MALDPEEEARLWRMYNLEPLDDAATAPLASTTTAFPPHARYAVLVSLLRAYQQGNPLPRTLADLAREHPLPAEVRATLEQVAADTGRPETEILAIFFALLAVDDVADTLHADFLTLLRGTVQASRKHRRLRATLMQRVFQ